MQAPGARIASLDLIRGVAVLGILAVNIAGFAGPSAALLTPDFPLPATFADKLAFAGVFAVFEGKMRALFTILFGAGIVLFVERADARREEGNLLQFRRLLWLIVFGLLHFFLFWWGDILFMYGVAGVIALFMRDLSPRAMLAAALIVFAGWHLGNAVAGLPEVRIEEHIRLGTATPAEVAGEARYADRFEERARGEIAEYRLGFVEQIAAKAETRPFAPVLTMLANLGETLPLVLIGMLLQSAGFFAGTWPPRELRRLAAIAGGGGLAITAGMLAWLWQRDFPPRAMTEALLYWTALPHLLMALAYAALLVLAAPRLTASLPGRLLTAAGRMALSNYIGTTIVMTAIFYGWGLGLVGTVGHANQLLFVLLGWALMIGFSALWLRCFRQGPLEWAWRSLVEKRFVPVR
jgi:uncharacterized protein